MAILKLKGKDLPDGTFDSLRSQGTTIGECFCLKHEFMTDKNGIVVYHENINMKIDIPFVDKTEDDLVVRCLKIMGFDVQFEEEELK